MPKESFEICYTENKREIEEDDTEEDMNGGS